MMGRSMGTAEPPVPSGDVAERCIFYLESSGRLPDHLAICVPTDVFLHERNVCVRKRTILAGQLSWKRPLCRIVGLMQRIFFLARSSRAQSLRASLSAALSSLVTTFEDDSAS